ncbi:ABC transporter ATP-binding protein [Halalkalibacter oceani]|uniref:Phosphate ABC transporter ATP-binding protein n=1 Tax=Halalkalibacter oceani TaxID=1653776 RepID=A0A9X2IMM5_9BACI|nr:phosphate ABC transporter ATP-binding protein [Halalkalibacter oceani]MCM3712911.1 phosphate ABC transporter ATP-binding protein [Halalkalibacter oceani]
MDIRWENVGSDRVTDMTFSIEGGQLVTIIGPSGAGKSSLLKLMNRLEERKSGMIYYRDKPITDYAIKDLRKRIGMAFQSPALFEGTVEDNILYGPRLHNLNWSKARLLDLLEAVHLTEDFLAKPVEELSGGEQQRVSLARTLANEPEVLLLDEVTSALDLRNAAVVEELIKHLQKQGKTILMVTHDLEQAERLGDLTFFIDNGRLVEQKESVAFFANPETLEARRFLYRDEEGGSA